MRPREHGHEYRDERGRRVEIGRLCHCELVVAILLMRPSESGRARRRAQSRHGRSTAVRGFRLDRPNMHRRRACRNDPRATMDNTDHDETLPNAELLAMLRGSSDPPMRDRIGCMAADLGDLAAGRRELFADLLPGRVDLSDRTDHRDLTRRR